MGTYHILGAVLKATTDGATSTTGVVTVTTTGDRNERGRVDKRYTRHTLTHQLVQLTYII